MHKDENLIGKVLGLDKQYDNALHSISFAVDGLKNSFHNLGVALFASSGGSIASAINGIAHGINILAEAMVRNPALGRAISAVAVGLGGIATLKLANSIANLTGVATALRVLGSAMLASPLALTISAIGVAVYEYWDGISAFCSGFVLGFGKAFGPNTRKMLSDFAADLKALFDSFFGLGEAVDDDIGRWSVWGQKLGSIIGPAVENAIGWLNKVADVLNMIRDAADAAGRAIHGVLMYDGGGVKPGVEAPFSQQIFDRTKRPFGGGMWTGGPVLGGTTYVVGEKGPELFIPQSNGFVLNNDVFGSAFGGGGGVGGFGAGGGFGGGGIAGSRGSWGGGMGRVGGSSPWHTSSQDERASFIKDYAASIGMDPNVALRVAQSEGFYNGLGDGGRSFGDFQLFTGGGVGNRALRPGSTSATRTLGRRRTSSLSIQRKKKAGRNGMAPRASELQTGRELTRQKSRP